MFEKRKMFCIFLLTTVLVDKNEMYPLSPSSSIVVPYSYWNWGDRSLVLHWKRALELMKKRVKLEQKCVIFIKKHYLKWSFPRFLFIHFLPFLPILVKYLPNFQWFSTIFGQFLLVFRHHFVCFSQFFVKIIIKNHRKLVKIVLKNSW